MSHGKIDNLDIIPTQGSLRRERVERTGESMWSMRIDWRWLRGWRRHPARKPRYKDHGRATVRRAALAGLLLLASAPALADPLMLKPGHYSRDEVPAFVVGTNNEAAWLFWRPDVQAVVLKDDDYQRCQASVAACEKLAASVTETKHGARAALPWALAGGVVLVFAAGVAVGAHAR